MANAERDENNVPVALGINSVDWVTTIPIEINPANWALQVEL